MKTKIFFTAILMFGLIQTSFSQYSEEWIARYNGPSNSHDGAAGLAIDKDGNVYVTGDSENRYLTIKYNSNGNQLWLARYNESYPIPYDQPHSIVLDSYQNVYVTGEAKGETYFYMDYVTAKYSSNGNQLWARIFDSPSHDHDRATAMVIDDSDNIIVTGFSICQCSSGNFTWNTIKYSHEGNQIWSSIFCGRNHLPLSGYAPSPVLAIDGPGNIIIAGNSFDTIISNEKYSIIKYNSNGQQLWMRNLNSYGDIYVIAADRSGNIYFAGQCDFNNTNIIKFDSNGDSLWVRNLTNATLTKIEIDEYGSVYGAGTSEPNGYFTAKYDSTGNLIWSSIDITGYRLRSMTIDNNGNVYETGNTIDNGDYYSVKYNTNGFKVWSSQYNGPGNSYDISYDIKVDNSENIYVTGRSVGIGVGSDYSTIKYSVITNANNTSTSVPDQFILFQNYPNPFNPNTVISYQLASRSGLPVSSFANIKVYDILGNEIATLVNEKQNAGSYSVEFDASNYPSGVYYYKLEAGSPREAGDFSEVRKMILLK